MFSFIMNRLMQSLLVACIISVLVFFGMYIISDPIETFVPEDATELDRQVFAQQHHLDKPILVQYGLFLQRIFQGDFGTSFKFGDPVLTLILRHLPATVELALTALVLALVIGIPVGIYIGIRPHQPSSRATMFMTTVGYSIPNFWQGIVLILTFAVTFQILPAGGRGETVTFLGTQWAFLTKDGFLHLILPAFNLALYKICMHIRLARSGTREVLVQEYMTFARAKGISKKRLIGRHLLKNISIPIVTLTGLELGTLIAFSSVTETVFSWPGIGKLLIDSIKLGDQPVVVAYLILISFMFVTINLIVDILYAVLDPRIRYQSGS